jgi:serine/threonine protein kinase
MASAVCSDCRQRHVLGMLEGLCPFCLFRAGRQSDYTLVNVLGRGDSGTIYLAERQLTHALVTVKVLNQPSEVDVAVERLRRQQQALALLAHPNAVEWVDVGLTTDGRPYVIRDYLRGAPITRYCEQAQSDRSARRGLVDQVFDVVAHAHRCGITHGRLKPSNVFVLMVAGEPTVKVMDFGLRPARPGDDDAALERLSTTVL